MQGLRERFFGAKKETSPPPPATQQGQLPTAEQVYAQLITQESVRPNMNEVIQFRVAERSLEYGILKDNRIPESAIRAGKVKRSDLLKAGFLFNNTIGGGEKAILGEPASVVINGKQQRIDFSKRTLLLKPELHAVIESQKQNPLTGNTGGVPLETVRKDMVAFIMEAARAKNKSSEIKNEAFLETTNWVLDPKNKSYTPDQKKILSEYLKNIKNSTLGFLQLACMGGLDLTKARGVPVDMLYTRLGIVQGIPSPYLDSGFHFGTNFDATLYPDDNARTRRLNMIVVHLLSRGLNETGSSVNGSHDQQYMTAGEYARTLYPKKQTAKSDSSITLSDEDRILIAKRLVYRARPGVSW